MTDGATGSTAAPDGQEPAATAKPAEETPFPPRKDAYYSLFVITVVVLFTVLDRGVFGLLIEPIKQDFGVTDTDVAILMGAAFSLPYGIASLFLGRIADQANRRNVIAGACAFWSAATVACGFVQNYTSLLIGRMAIGAGESGYGPAAWSIATDNWPREKVAFATGVMGIGAQVGVGLSMFLGGTILLFVSGLEPLQVPMLGIIRPWQWTFVLVGAPGLLWALIVLTSKEPPRRGLGMDKKVQKVPVKDVAKWIADDRRTYIATVGGMAIKAFILVSSTTWNATLLHRRFEWELADVGIILGTVMVIIAPIGMLAGAKLSEYWTKLGRKDANLRIVFYGTLLSVPLQVAGPIMPTPFWVIAFSAAAGFIGALGFGPSVAAFQTITPNRMRGQMGALVQFCNNVIAASVSPIVVALFTDYLFRDPMDLGYSMALNAAIFGTLGIIAIAQGLKPYVRSYERALRDFGN